MEQQLQDGRCGICGEYNSHDQYCPNRQLPQGGSVKHDDMIGPGSHEIPLPKSEKVQIAFLEFNDAADPESNAYEKEGKTSFKLSVEPEMYLLAMINTPGELTADILPAVRKLLNVAYEQGKRVGRLDRL